MAETKKSTRARKPARTIEQQIADLQAKQEAVNEKRAASLAARHAVFTDQLTKAQRERQMMITLNDKLTRAEAAYAAICTELQAAKDEIERARDQHEALRSELARAVEQGEKWKTDRDKWIKAFTKKDAVRDRIAAILHEELNWPLDILLREGGL